MKVFSRMLYSEIIKMKKSNVLLTHLLIPLLGIGVFLGAFAISSYTDFAKVVGYMQVVGVVFPAMISIVSALYIEKESVAGNFINMLIGTKVKVLTFISKMLVIVVLGFLASILACVGFFIGVKYVFHNDLFSIKFYIIIACIFLVSSIFSYIFHLFLNMKYGKSVSISIGITESFISALLLTNLGHGIWPYIPCTWGSRFANYFSVFSNNLKISTSDIREIHLAIVILIILTVFGFIISNIWFYFWSGRNSES